MQSMSRAAAILKYMFTCVISTGRTYHNILSPNIIQRDFTTKLYMNDNINLPALYHIYTYTLTQHETS